MWRQHPRGLPRSALSSSGGKNNISLTFTFLVIASVATRPCLRSSLLKIGLSISGNRPLMLVRNREEGQVWPNSDSGLISPVSSPWPCLDQILLKKRTILHVNGQMKAEWNTANQTEWKRPYSGLLSWNSCHWTFLVWSSNHFRVWGLGPRTLSLLLKP